jgi:hypothetical protein
VKLPTGIVGNSLQPYIYSVALGYISEHIDEAFNVIDQLASHNISL